MSTDITVIYSINDNYAEMACVSMTSLVHNTRRNCNIHVFENSVSKLTAQKIAKLEDIYENVKITFHHISDDSFEEVGDDRYGKEIWYPLLAPEILDNLDKTLVLGADTLVCGDISSLFDIQLGKNYIAARTPAIVVERGQDNSLTNLINPYNSKIFWDVLILNLKCLREDDLFNIRRLTEFVQEIRPHTNPWMSVESYVSAVVEWERFLCIPGKYNSVLINHMTYLVNT